MKVICRQNYPSEKQNIALGYDKGCTVGYELTVNQEYTVLGVNFQSTSLLNKGVILLLRDDIGRCGFVPMCLLEVSSPSPSRFWMARKNDEYDLCFWPEEFFLEYFHDDLSEGVTAAVETFERVYQVLNKEADAQASRIQESILEPVSIVKIK